MIINMAEKISIDFCCKELYKAIVRHELTLPYSNKDRVLMVPFIGIEIRTCPFCKSEIYIENLHSDGAFDR